MATQRAFLALGQGFRLCFFNSKVRKLAMWPWLISMAVYLLVAAAAWFSHEPLINWLVPAPAGFFQWALYYLVWIVSGLFLVVGTLIVSLILAIILTGVFQEAIAQEVLQANGVKLPNEAKGVSGFVKEMLVSIKSESLKLFWLVPLGLLVVLMSFAPILAPLAFVIAAWILGFESADVVWQVLKKPATKRFAFARTNWIAITLYGLSLTAIGLIPFAGILLPPIAIAGAAWMLAENELPKTIS